VSKKFLAASTAALVLVTTMVSGISAASAANVKNGACTKANASATIGGVKYKCTFNPSKAVKKNTWVAQTCLDASSNFNDVKDLNAAIVTSTNGTINTANRSKATNQKQITIIQTKLTTLQTALNSFMAQHPTVKTNGAPADQQRVTTAEANIVKMTTEVQNLTANLSTLDQTIADANASMTKTSADIAAAKAVVTKACA